MDNDTVAPTGPETYNFETALGECKAGKKIQRAGWNGKGMYITVIRGFDPTSHVENYSINPNVWDGEGLPWLALKTADNKMVPWLASQTDILANDWVVLA